jgi:hypothetical protein
MKMTCRLLITLGLISLGGCVIVPFGTPPAAYVGPRGVGPYVAVSPYYYGYGPRFYYGRRW